MQRKVTVWLHNFNTLVSFKRFLPNFASSHIIYFNSFSCSELFCGPFNEEAPLWLTWWGNSISLWHRTYQLGTREHREKLIRYNKKLLVRSLLMPPSRPWIVKLYRSEPFFSEIGYCSRMTFILRGKVSGSTELAIYTCSCWTWKEATPWFISKSY